MKKIYLLVFLNTLFNHLNAQNFEWSKVEGHYAYDYGYGIATDETGNVYVAGKYEENAVFSGTTLPCQGNHDIYVAKYTSDGSLSWIKTGGGTNGDYARALACNKTSRVYIAGEIEGSPTPVVFPGTSETLITQGDNDVFLATYDLNGNLLWVKSEGGIKNEKADGITYDNNGNVIICGYFTDTTKFNGTLIPGKGEEDMFVAKYDMNGNFLWMQHAGGPLHDAAKSVKCDASGNIYVCGMYSDGAVFGGSTFTTANTAWGKFYDCFIAKYSPSGSLIWVKRIVGDYDDVAWSLVLDNNGKIYVTGEFSSADFGGGMIWSYGLSDVFVACYDLNGNFQWVAQAGGQMVDRARGMGTDGTNVFITGQIGGTTTFGSHTISSADSSDIFIAEVSNTGTFRWAKTVGGAADAYENNSYESGIAVTADASGVAYVTGSLLSGGNFGGITPAFWDRSDMFIAKMSSLTGITENKNNPELHIYPNPGKGVFIIESDEYINNKTEIKVYNYLGDLVNDTKPTSSKISIDLSDQPKGIYFIQLVSEKKTILEKIILQ
jgi:hypothetical protein